MASNKIKKSKFDSYILNDIPLGCKSCIKGEKLVLFITGQCKTGCKYCPLSDKRKGTTKTWANEKECNSLQDLITEAKESNSKGAGITGGDPLLVLDKTIEYASALKKEFGPSFHIHIYLSTTLVTKEALEKLSKVIDEVRFHPLFLEKDLSKTEIEEELKKIALASLFFKRENIGIELPIFPDKKRETYEFLKKASTHIGFVNLNELEIGDTNFDFMTNNYEFNSDGYTAKSSVNAGIWILNECIKDNLDLKMHLCTARTKNWHQYRMRLLKHEILPYGTKTDEGTVIYYCAYPNQNEDFSKFAESFDKSKIFIDHNKKRIIFPKNDLSKYRKDYKIRKVEESPTFERDELEIEDLS